MICGINRRCYHPKALISNLDESFPGLFPPSQWVDLVWKVPPHSLDTVNVCLFVYGMMHSDVIDVLLREKKRLFILTAKWLIITTTARNNSKDRPVGGDGASCPSFLSVHERFSFQPLVKPLPCFPLLPRCFLPAPVLSDGMWSKQFGEKNYEEMFYFKKVRVCCFEAFCLGWSERLHGCEW